MGVNRLLDKHVDLEYQRVLATRDVYGQPVRANDIVPAVCYYRLVSTDDMDAVAREQIDYKVYLPISSDVVSLVAVVINGERYEVQGPAHRQWNPRLMRDEFWVLSVRRAD